MHAAASGNGDYAYAFIDTKMADYKVNDVFDRDVVFHAIRSGSLQMVGIITNNGYNKHDSSIFGGIDKNGHCPITYALAMHSPEIVYPMVCEFILDSADIHLAFQQAVKISCDQKKLTHIILQISDREKGLRSFIKYGYTLDKVVVPLIKIVAAMIKHDYQKFYDAAGVTEESYSDVSFDHSQGDFRLYQDQVQLMKKIASAYNCFKDVEVILNRAEIIEERNEADSVISQLKRFGFRQ